MVPFGVMIIGFHGASSKGGLTSCNAEAPTRRSWEPHNLVHTCIDPDTCINPKMHQPKQTDYINHSNLSKSLHTGYEIRVTHKPMQNQMLNIDLIALSDLDQPCTWLNKTTGAVKWRTWSLCTLNLRIVKTESKMSRDHPTSKFFSTYEPQARPANTIIPCYSNLSDHVTMPLTVTTKMFLVPTEKYLKEHLPYCQKRRAGEFICNCTLCVPSLETEAASDTRGEPKG